MREISILNPDGDFEDDLASIVQSHMIYPNDTASVEEDIFVHRYRRVSGYRDTELGRFLENQWQDAKLGGMQAGSILYTILQFSVHRPDIEFSLRKSKFMVRDELEERFRTARKANKNTINLSKSDGTIAKAWTKYKDCAHLWASLMLLMKENSSGSGVDFRYLLSISEQIAQLAEPHIPEWKPWRVPDAAKLPIIQLNISEPDAEDIARAMKYRVSPPTEK